MEAAISFIITCFFIIFMLLCLISSILPIGISFLPTRKISLLFLIASFLLFTLITNIFFSSTDGVSSKIASAIILFPLIVTLAYFIRRSLISHHQVPINNGPNKDLSNDTQPSRNEPNSLVLYEEEIYVAGTYYREDEVLDFLSLDKKYIRTLPEPDNPYDQNAIKVMGYGTEGNNEYSYHIGYLAREYAQALNRVGVQNQIYTKLSDLNFDYPKFDDDIEIVIQLYGPANRLDNYNYHLKQAFVELSNRKRRELNS